jgi:hypothetical protein
MKSYTHAVFIKGKEDVVMHTLHEVSYALLQVKELCSSEEYVVGLLWVLEYLKKPSKGYFKNPARENLKESLLEFEVLKQSGSDFELDSVFSRVLKEVEKQNRLYIRAFRLIQNLPKDETPNFSDTEEEEFSPIKDKFTLLSESLSLSLDFWDQETGAFSNPDKIPERILRIKIGKPTYQFLKSLKW